MALTSPSFVRPHLVYRRGRCAYIFQVLASANSATSSLLQIGPPAGYELFVKRAMLLNPGFAGAASTCVFVLNRYGAVPNAGTDVSSGAVPVDDRDVPFAGAAQKACGAGSGGIGVGSLIVSVPTAAAGFAPQALYDGRDGDYLRVKSGTCLGWEAFLFGGGAVSITNAQLALEMFVQPAAN